MKTQKAIACLFASVMLLACAVRAQELRPADGKTHPELLMSTQWVADHLSDPKLVIVDVGMAGMGSMDGMADYKSGHIPGAREIKDDQIASGGFPGTELLATEKLKANLEAIGISDDSRVVIYSSHWAPMAARLFFTLDYLGFKNAALLDGGIERWRQEKRPISSEVPRIAAGSLTVHPHPEIVARMPEMQQWAAEREAAVVLVDARPMKRYASGHLPGAVPIFWENNLVGGDDTRLKSPEALRNMYSSQGVTPGKKVVSYCEVGLQASYAYFIARYLGFDAALYDGSWNEWSKQKLPSVRGERAR